jgi:hypothetical protein
MNQDVTLGQLLVHIMKCGKSFPKYDFAFDPQFPGQSAKSATLWTLAHDPIFALWITRLKSREGAKS